MVSKGKEVTDYNNVSKPAHYNQGEGIECIDSIPSP